MKLKLAELRERAGITQAELALRLSERLGTKVDQSRVSRYESASDALPASWLQAWLEALGYDPVDVFRACLDEEHAQHQQLDWGDPYGDLRRNVQLVSDYAVRFPELEALEGTDWIDTRENLLDVAHIMGRKPTLGIVGQFDAGKTTLANHLLGLGSHGLPVSYQPTTKIPTYIQHISDRPEFIRESVWLMRDADDAPFDLLRRPTKEYYEQHKLLAGNLETLREYGTHGGAERAESGSEPSCALVYLDAPILRTCNVLDLPGFENMASDDDAAFTSFPRLDLAIYLSPVNGFMSSQDRMRLQQLIVGLPLIEAEAEHIPPLANLFVVVSHAAVHVSDDQVADVLNKGAKQLFQTLASSLEERARHAGKTISYEDVRARFFPFWSTTRSRHEALENDLREKLMVVIPAVWKSSAERTFRELKKRALERCRSALLVVRRSTSEFEETTKRYENLRKTRARRKRRLEEARDQLLERVAEYQNITLTYFDEAWEQLFELESLERFIETTFVDKTDAQKDAFSTRLSQLNARVEAKLEECHKELATDVETFLTNVSSALSLPQGEQDSVTVPIDTGALFFGGAVGVGAVGALAAVASTMGNLGAYILVARAVSLASALGVPFGFSGGTAGIISLVAALGGPLTIAGAIVVMSSLMGLGLFGERWEGRLAKQIVKVSEEKGVRTRYRSALKKHWQDTRKAIHAGFASIVDAEAKQYGELKALVGQGRRSRELVERRIDALETALEFFEGFPWLPLDMESLPAA